MNLDVEFHHHKAVVNRVHFDGDTSNGHVANLARHRAHQWVVKAGPVSHGYPRMFASIDQNLLDL